MEQNEALQQEVITDHPLIATYPEWLGDRRGRQTKTTMTHIEEALAKQDIELLETYDRLLGDKGGAWIKHVVKAVRKKPELGTVEGITTKHLHAYMDMRMTVNAIIYSAGNAKYDSKVDRNRTSEYELFDFALSNPDRVRAVCALIQERGFLELQSVLELLDNIESSHSAIAEGAL